MLNLESRIPTPLTTPSRGEATSRSTEELESLVRRRTAALRSLSARLLRVQDEERRRLARELHDSTGQTLIALKLHLAIIQQRLKAGLSSLDDFAQVNILLDHALQDIRTTSYLLFPPLLDEQGLCSAAQWYVEGFSNRSNIAVKLSLDPIGRLSGVVETTLFRVLQESLTNIYRHSASQTVDVHISLDEVNVILNVRDYGKGMPSQLLEQFRRNGNGAGVGLAAMRDRIEECDGVFEIFACMPGTLIRATVPFESAELGPCGSGDFVNAIAA